MKLLLLEFNEIEQELLQRGIEAGELPAFARLRKQSSRYTTDACDGYLEPWVQWVTLHTGVTLEHHGALQLTLGRDVPQPFFWERIAAAGHRSWICGAMNGRDRDAPNLDLLLDYWTEPSADSYYAPFACFANACVTRHIDRRHRIRPSEALAFIAFMLRNGLRPGTALRVASQTTRAIAARQTWRLAFALEDLQLDLFLHRCRLQPELALLFVNSVAHLQHNYWQDMDPARFTDRQAAGRSRHAGAIPAGYRHLDRVLERALAVTSPETTVLLCSALGQEPRGDDHPKGTTLYRVRDLPRLIAALAIPAPDRTVRTMADTFILEYRDEERAALSVERLASVRVGEAAPFKPLRRGGKVLVDGDLTHATDPGSEMSVDGRPSGWRLEQLMTIGHHVGGVHHPRGLLWVRGRFPLPEQAPGDPIPLTEIAPAIERCFGIPSAGETRR